MVWDDESNADVSPKHRSFKPEVIADNSGEWCSNNLRFPTREEAELYAIDLQRRWTLVQRWRVVGCDEDPNSRFVTAKSPLSPAQVH
jgi:hypothetical protein